MTTLADAPPPLVVHVIHELGIGGLENGLVNLVNRMPANCYRHAIVCMAGAGEFRQRIQRPDVEVYALHRDQQGLIRTYWNLFRLFRRLQPQIVHTRNRSGLDALLPALLSGVPVRIHGEHGRDIDDLDGSNPRYRRLKRLFRPLVSHYTAVSQDLASYLQHGIGVPAARISQVYNGVDTGRFRPPPRSLNETPEASGLVIGTVGRLQPVKDHATLVAAFAAAVQRAPEPMREATLVIVGDGPSRPAVEHAIQIAGIGSRVQILGARDDVPALLRTLDIFVLPSLAEGISNTILEAMATGLPIVATHVGGNLELLIDRQTGALVAAGDWNAMADAIVDYARDPARRAAHGQAARDRAEREFSLETMVTRYSALYDRWSRPGTIRSPRSTAHSATGRVR